MFIGSPTYAIQYSSSHFFSVLRDGANHFMDLTLLFFRSIPETETLKEMSLNFFCIETDQQLQIRQEAIEKFERLSTIVKPKNPYLNIDLELGCEILKGPSNEEEFFSFSFYEESFSDYLNKIEKAHKILNPDANPLDDEVIDWDFCENILKNLQSEWLYQKIYEITEQERLESSYQPAYSINGRWNLEKLIQAIEKVVESIFKRLFPILTVQEIQQIQDDISFVNEEMLAIQESHPCSKIDQKYMRVILSLSRLTPEEFQIKIDDQDNPMISCAIRVFKWLADKGVSFLPTEDRDVWEATGLREQGFKLKYKDSYVFTWSHIEALRDYLINQGNWLGVNIRLRSLEERKKHLQSLLD
jgi:hypothetical protein